MKMCQKATNVFNEKKSWQYDSFYSKKKISSFAVKKSLEFNGSINYKPCYNQSF